MEKINPEYSTHTYTINMRKLKSAFGIKGKSITNLRTVIVDDNIEKDKKITGIEITTRQFKDEIEEEEKIIPDGEPSARG